MKGRDRIVMGILIEELEYLAGLALNLGTTERVTRHSDGKTPETVTTHTTMLGLVATAIASEYARYSGLDVGKVAQYALVHDLVEAQIGDTQTLVATDEDLNAKALRERVAANALHAEFTALPWVMDTWEAYERREDAESVLVWIVDKALPKLLHLRNRGVTYRNLGMSAVDVRERYERQRQQVRGYLQTWGGLRGVGAWYEHLLDLEYEMTDRVLAPHVLRPVCQIPDCGCTGYAHA